MEPTFYYSKKILAFLGFNPRAALFSEDGEDTINNRCYVYPRFYQTESGDWNSINPDDFPTVGRIDVVIQNGQSAEEVVNQLRKVVLVQINSVSPKTEANAKTRYRSRYNPAYENNADIVIKELSSIPLNLWQILPATVSSEQFIRERKIENFESAIYTSIVLVKTQDSVFGPFRYDKKGTCIEFTGLQECHEIAGQYSLLTISSMEMEINDAYSSDIASFVSVNKSSYNEFINTHTEKKIDWVSDTALIDMLMSTIKKSTDLGYFKSQIRQIRSAIDDAVALEDQLSITKERKTRLESLLQKGDLRADLLEQITYFMMENPDASQRLLETIATDKFDLIKDKITQLPEIQENIANKQHELDQINSSIAESRERAMQANKEEFERIASDKQKQILQLEQDIAALEAHKTELEKNTQLAGSILEMQKKKDSLSDEIKELQSNYDYVKGQNDRLEEQVKKILNDLKSEASLSGKLIERKLIDRVLKNVSGEDLEEGTLQTPFDKALLTNAVPGKTIIDYVYNDLQHKANRNVTRNDITNYLLCVTQGFITVFAGVPGTGKTSLCYLLAKSLGLARKGSNNRYLEVSVERGWSSHKDYIGYYNPLTKRLEKSDAEIFNAFQLLENEAETLENAPFFILLDEANLSPIEHYWAPFLKLCDSDSCSGNMLVLGGDVKWRVPEHLRFLATVNFDHTTEELSPRFLDRAWIISLEPEMLKLVDIEDDSVTCNTVTYDFASLEESFSIIGKEEDIPKSITTKWENIQKIFKENKIPIMPRNLKMVKNYLFAACFYMDMQSEETKFAPIDYAVAQKILPTINGSGDKYEKLISDLLFECDSMPISKRHLERMKKAAENNLSFYQFFTR